MVESKADENPQKAQAETTADDIEIQKRSSSSAKTPGKSNLKRKREEGVDELRKSVGFSEEKKIEIFEIEDGNNFKKLPTPARLKSMAGRWSNPFSINRVSKRLRVDEFEPEDDGKSKDKPQEEGEAKECAKKAAPVEPKVDVSGMTDEQKEAHFLKTAKKAFLAMANASSLLKLNSMVPALKATGLMEHMKSKYGGTRKWFTLQTKTFGLSAENFISMRGHGDEFTTQVIAMLNAAPKKMLKLHLLDQQLRSKLSENGFRKNLKGYTSFKCYIMAHSSEFLISQKGDFVTPRKEFISNA